VILDIDAGNTRIKWRVLDGDRVVGRGDQLTELIRQGMPLEIIALNSLDRIRLSCVAGQDIVTKLQSQFSGQFDAQIELAEVTENIGSVVCGYKDHDQLGIDRWLALLAAYAKNSDAVVVVDAGSAVTVDIVSTEAMHLGGYIVPGLQLMHKALWQGTDRIKVEAKRAMEINSPGQTTAEAVDKGCLLVLVAMIESLLARHQARLIITGGDAELLQNALAVEAELYPDLVLDGLSLKGISLRAVDR
jgi:type III pantothenate kinase